jgi:hypothetical protein
LEQDLREAGLRPPVFDPRPRTRQQAYQKLVEWFGDDFAPKPQTLARLAHEGRGPPYARSANGRAAYFESQLWQWGVNRFRKAVG